MKFTLEADVTPKEFREALGLPDVAGLQKEIIDAVRRRMEQGIDDFDPVAMARSWLSQGIVGVSELQRMFMKLATESKSDPAPERPRKKTPSKK